MEGLDYFMKRDPKLIADMISLLFLKPKDAFKEQKDQSHYAAKLFPWFLAKLLQKELPDNQSFDQHHQFVLTILHKVKATNPHL